MTRPRLQALGRPMASLRAASLRAARLGVARLGAASLRAASLRLAWLLALLLLPLVAQAVSDPSEMLPNPVQEKRAEAVGDQLRCLVCQNESIEQSDAGLARDLRRIIRQRVVAGDSNRQIIAWMVARYGEFVRLKPPFDPATLLLWGAPVIALGAGATAIVLVRRHPAAPPPPLTEEQRRQAATLLGE